MKKHTFETCTVEIKVNGQFHCITSRKDVTPPEFRVLQRVHGGEVLLLEVTEPVERTQEDELTRLRNWYKVKAVDGAFPGEYPFLPTTFKAARIPVEDPENVIHLTDGGHRKGKRKAPAKDKKAGDKTPLKDAEESEELDEEGEGNPDMFEQGAAGGQ